MQSEPSNIDAFSSEQEPETHESPTTGRPWRFWSTIWLSLAAGVVTIVGPDYIFHWLGGDRVCAAWQTEFRYADRKWKFHAGLHAVFLSICTLFNTVDHQTAETEHAFQLSGPKETGMEIHGDLGGLVLRLDGADRDRLLPA